MGFFDATPVGRLLNRFSRDVNTIDETIPATFTMYINLFFTALATFTAIAFVFPAFLLFLLPLLLFYRYVQNYYIPTSRQLQRLDSVLRSPIYQHFSETLEGTTTIKAFRQQKRFMRICEAKIDQESRAYYLYVASNRWLALRLEFVGTSVIAFTAFCAVLASLQQSPSSLDASFFSGTSECLLFPFSHASSSASSEGGDSEGGGKKGTCGPLALDSPSFLHLLLSSTRAYLLQLVNILVGSVSSLSMSTTITAGLGGLAISYALNITQQLNWLVRAASDTESNILAVERVKEYIDDTPSERLQPEKKTTRRPHPQSLLVAPTAGEGEQEEETPSGIPVGWPTEGRIELRHLIGRYKDAGPIILKGVSASFHSGEKSVHEGRGKLLTRQTDRHSKPS